MPIERKLAAIMFTDIVGYTEQMSQDEAVAISLLNKKESVLKPLIAKHNGTYVKSTGDGSLSHFNSAVDAATCAKRFQESIYDDKNLNVRVGVHLGDTIFEKGDIRGDGVNIASRLESIAVEGGVFVSKEVHDQLSNQKEFEGVSLGLQSMKGVGRLIEVYGLKGDMLSEPNPDKYQDNKIDKHSDDEVPSIAIIPFENKGKEEDVFYTYGISADLISDCSGAGLIRVASKTDIEKLDYQNLDNSELSQKLDVRYIANGELWRMGDMFQLSVELYDTKDKKVVWSDRWQEKWDNLPTIKGSLSDGLLQTLDTKPKVGQKVDTTNPEAYEFYLKALYKFNNRKNKEDIKILRLLLEKSIELDDNACYNRNLLGRTYLDTGEYSKSKDNYMNCLAIAKKSNNKIDLADIWDLISEFYSRTGDFSQSIKYSKKALQIYQEINCKMGILSSFFILGINSSYQNKLEQALLYYNKALNIAEVLHSKNDIASILNSIGNIASDKEEYDKALYYYNRALSIDGELDNDRGKCAMWNNISGVYRDKGNLDLSLHYLSLSTKIAKRLDIKPSLSTRYFNLGMIFIIKGDYGNAKKNINISLELANQISNEHRMIYPILGMGLLYYHHKDYNKAKNFFSKSFSMQKEIGDKEFNLYTIIYLYNTLKNLGEKFDKPKIEEYIKEKKYIMYECNYQLYELLKEFFYLENAYKQIQEKADNLEPDVAAKFLSYPIPKAIVEEWEKVK